MYEKLLRSRALTHGTHTEPLDRAYATLRSSVVVVAAPFLCRLRRMDNVPSHDRDPFIKFTHVQTIYRDMHQQIRWQLEE